MASISPSTPHTSLSRMYLMPLIQFLLQLRGRREEGPRQVQRRSSSRVCSGGEESPQEEAGPEEGASRGLHGQLLRRPGGLPDQDAGQTSTSHLLIYLILLYRDTGNDGYCDYFHRITWPETSTTSASWHSLWPSPSTSSCSSTK